MTVIAFDGRTLAADKRATDHRGKTSTTTKIHRAPGGELLACVGDASVCAELLAWFVAGAEPVAFPQSARASVADLYVFGPGGVLCYCAGPYPFTVECRHFAAGSGGDVAKGAMFMGADARKAVEAACSLRGDCGNGIDVLETMRASVTERTAS